MMVLKTRWHRLSAPDAQSQTVARLTLDESRFQDRHGGAAGDLRARLNVHPMPGFEDEPGPLLEALAAVGQRPADYSTNIDHQVDPEARADLVTVVYSTPTTGRARSHESGPTIFRK
jgi:hypothetical protein